MTKILSMAVIKRTMRPYTHFLILIYGNKHEFPSRYLMVLNWWNWIRNIYQNKYICWRSWFLNENINIEQVPSHLSNLRKNTTREMTVVAAFSVVKAHYYNFTPMNFCGKLLMNILSTCRLKTLHNLHHSKKHIGS